MKRESSEITPNLGGVRRVAVVAAVTGALVAGLPGVREANAHAPWPHNGCTFARDSWYGVFDFKHACDHHDGCYVQHWGSQWTCDVWFLNDMIGSCYGYTRAWTWQRSACISTAWTYFNFVRSHGWSFYWIWAPMGVRT